MKIGNKLIISFLLMGLLIGVVGFVSFVVSHNSLEKNIGEGSAVLSRELLSEIDSELNERQLDIQLLANSHTPRHFLTEISETGISLAHPVGGVNDDLVSFSGNNFNLWDEVFIIGIDGEIKAASDESVVGQPLSSFGKTGLAQALTGEFFISDAFLNPLTNRITMIFAAPVRRLGSDGTFKEDLPIKGAVVGYLNWEDIATIMKSSELAGQKRYKTMHLKLTNKDGKMLYSTKEFDFFDDISAETMSTITVREAHSLNAENKEYYWVGVEPEEHQKNEVLISYARSVGHDNYKGFDWLVFVEYEAHEIFASAKELRNIILGFSFFAILLSILIGFFVSRSIVDPIQRLSKTAQKISRGDLNVRTKIRSRDEIGQLAQLFNSMAVSLKESRQKIEEKVKEQTRKINKQKQGLEKQQRAILNILQDVEEEKNRTIEEKDKVDALLQSIGDGVFVVDQNYNVTMFNHVASSISGFSASDAIGKRYDSTLKFIYEKSGNLNSAFIKVAMATGKVQTMAGQTNLIRKDGSRVPVADSAAPVKNKNGEITGCIVVFRDVTHEREIDKMKTEFVSIASHQLRTPLTAIKLFVEMLVKQTVGELNEKQLDYMEKVRRSTERMIKLVNDLLNVSRLETGKLRINPEPAQLEDFIEEIISDLIVMARARNYTIVFNKPKKQLTEVMVDKALLHQVIHNLISNAIRYSVKKKSQITVALKTIKDKQTKKEDIIISVKDNGIGISKGIQSRIFEKFFRSDAAQKAEAEGSGLGLYVAKLIIEAGGGQIWFESERRTGTTFYVRIPSEGMKAKKGERNLAGGNGHRNNH